MPLKTLFGVIPSPLFEIWKYICHFLEEIVAAPHIYNVDLCRDSYDSLISSLING